MPFPLKGVIFDFDGPIFDGRAASQQALAATFEHYAAQVGRPAIAMTTLPLYGPGALIALAYADTPAAAPMLADIRDFCSKALEACEGQSTIVPGILPILQHLKGRGITCAILSSRKTAELVERINALGLRALFREIWGGDAPAGQKPDPAVVLALAD